MAARATVILLIFASLCVRLVTSREFFVEKGKQVSWYQAHVECVKKGYKGLATASNADQENELIQAIEKDAPEERYFWIGLTDLGEHNNYVWFPTGEEMSYTNWAPNEPAGRKDEDCIALMKLDKWLWNDDICQEDKAKFVCEK